MNETIVFRIDPPLPCCALIAIQRRCNAPATVVHATRMRDGSYHIQPFCKSCVTGMAKVYGVNRVNLDE